MNTSTPSAPRPARTLTLGALAVVACSAGCNLTSADTDRILTSISGGTAEYTARELGMGDAAVLVRTAAEVGSIVITSQIRAAATDAQKAEAAQKAKAAYQAAPPDVKQKIDAGEVKIAVQTSDGKTAVTDRNGAMVPDPETRTQVVYDVPKDDQTKLAQAKGNGKLNDMNVWYSDN